MRPIDTVLSFIAFGLESFVEGLAKILANCNRVPKVVDASLTYFRKLFRLIVQSITSCSYERLNFHIATSRILQLEVTDGRYATR